MIFGKSVRVRGPFRKQEEVEVLSRYLEKVFTQVFDEGSAKYIAYKLLEDKEVLPLLLKISWDYLKLSNKYNRYRAELSQKLDEALQIANFVKARGGT